MSFENTDSGFLVICPFGKLTSFYLGGRFLSELASMQFFWKPSGFKEEVFMISSLRLLEIHTTISEEADFVGNTWGYILIRHPFRPQILIGFHVVPDISFVRSFIPVHCFFFKIAAYPFVYSQIYSDFCPLLHTSHQIIFGVEFISNSFVRRNLTSFSSEKCFAYLS